MKMKVITAQRVLFSGDGPEAILPGEDGEFTVMDFHQPCLARLKEGFLRFRVRNMNGGERSEVFSIRGGVSRVGPFGISVLVEEAVVVKS